MKRTLTWTASTISRKYAFWERKISLFPIPSSLRSENPGSIYCKGIHSAIFVTLNNYSSSRSGHFALNCDSTKCFGRQLEYLMVDAKRCASSSKRLKFYIISMKILMIVSLLWIFVSIQEIASLFARFCSLGLLFVESI